MKDKLLKDRGGQDALRSSAVLRHRWLMILAERSFPNHRSLADTAQGFLTGSLMSAQGSAVDSPAVPDGDSSSFS